MQKVERQGGQQVQAGSALAGMATPRQLGFIKKLAKDRGLDDEGLFDECQSRFNVLPELLTAKQASQLIEAWK